MHIRRISMAKYPYPIRIPGSVRIADIRKISIRRYISAHLCPFAQ